MIHLRYPLMSNWKTDFIVKYKINLKSMLSSSAEDGSRIMRISSGETDMHDLKAGDEVKTIINLPEGATLKSINAPFAQSVDQEYVQGILNKYIRITIIHDRSLTSKITINYFDSSGMLINLATFICYYILPLVLCIILVLKVDFSIENSQETDNLNAQKKHFSKLCKNTKTYLKMLNNFQGILENYKIKKDMTILNQAFQLFKQNCALFLEKQLQPYIAACNNADILPLIIQISEAHQQHIEALYDFHHGNMDRQSYINNRRVIDDVIDQAEKQIILQLSEKK